MLNRSEVINYFMSALKLTSYLELGVEAGVTFNAVVANRKVAIDPAFKIAQSELKGASRQITSDAFFDSNLTDRFDLIFIDGLHTFEQSLRDALRSLPRLTENGILIIDDCYPSDYLASLRDHGLCALAKEREGLPDRNWMGDVYKTVLFINEFYDSLDFSYVQDTMGIVVVWKKLRRLTPLFRENPVADIANLEYARFKHTLFPKLPKKSLSQILDCINSSHLAPKVE
jgi:hypothetical protein